MASTISAGTTSGTAIAITGDTSGALALLTNNGTTAVTIDTSQNVGIGTSSPAYKLHVNTTFDHIHMTNPTTGTTGSDGFTLDAFGTSARLIQRESAPMEFYTAATERMRIDSSGRPLFNTTSALNAGYMSLLFDGSAYNGFTLKTSYATTGSVYLYFINSAGNVAGFVSQNGTTTVSYSTSSDYRLKENIAPMTGALAKVALLNPVSYKWKSDGSDGQGFIAHELQEVVPDCVTGEKDAVDADGKPVYQGIDTSFLVATLTAAIQEQQAIITDLKTRIETLEAK